MSASSDDRHISDDMDTLTVMNEDIVMEASSSNDTRYQRDVSQIREDFRAGVLTGRSNFGS